MCVLPAWLSPCHKHLFILHLEGFIEFVFSPVLGPCRGSICIHISQVLEITSAHKCHYFQRSWCKPYLLPKHSAKKIELQGNGCKVAATATTATKKLVTATNCSHKSKRSVKWPSGGKPRAKAEEEARRGLHSTHLQRHQVAPA